MNPDDVISVLSVQHTGTWFTLEFLKLHPEVRFFSEYLNLLPAHPGLNKIYQACMESLLGPTGKRISEEYRSKDAAYDPRLLRGLTDATLQVLVKQPSRVLLHQHTQSPRRRLTGLCDGNMYAEAFHELFRTVVPIRDPLLSLITRQHRHPSFRNSNLVDDFEFVIELMSNSCFFFPVDLLLDADRRLALLRQLLAFVGLSAQPYIIEVARDWTPKNTKGDYDLKRWYRAGNLSRIARVIPKELAFLQSKEAVIRPFLERLGYSNLLWWR